MHVVEHAEKFLYTLFGGVKPKMRPRLLCSNMLSNRSRKLRRLATHIFTLVAIRICHTRQHLRECGHATVLGFMRVIRAAEKWPQRIWFKKHAHGPAAVTGHHHCGSHVQLINVRPLFAIELDTHKIRVHLPCGRFVLEALTLHHMAPIARAIADTQKKRHVPLSRKRERLLAPGMPINRIVRVLQQVWT